MLLGVALAGMAHISARHWLATHNALTKEQASDLIATLAWRGIGSLPLAAGEAKLTTSG